MRHWRRGTVRRRDGRGHSRCKYIRAVHLYNAVAGDAHVTLTKDKSCDKRVTGEGDKLPPSWLADAALAGCIHRAPCGIYIYIYTECFRLINIVFGPIRGADFLGEKRAVSSTVTFAHSPRRFTFYTLRE